MKPSNAMLLTSSLVALLLITVMHPGSTIAAAAPTDASPATADPLPVPSETQSPATPEDLRRSAYVEKDDVRVRLVLDRNPLPSGEKTWMTTIVRNLSDEPLLIIHDTCRTIVNVHGVVEGVEWQPGTPIEDFSPTTFKYRAARWGAGRPDPVRVTFFPRRMVARLGPDGVLEDLACGDTATATRVAPRGVVTSRALWNGTADLRLGPPPDGPLSLVGTTRYARPAWRNVRSIEVSLESAVVDGPDPGTLHPMEVVDAAVADPGFRAFIEPIEIGVGNTDVVSYDPTRDVWDVGVYYYADQTLEVAEVDPRTGEVSEVVTRKKRK